MGFAYTDFGVGEWLRFPALPAKNPEEAQENERGRALPL
jgi:hypothetical protein